MTQTLRVLGTVALGAALWLLLIPAPFTDGDRHPDVVTCGVPVINAAHDSHDWECVQLNQVRVRQAFQTAVPGLVMLFLSRMQWLDERTRGAVANIRIVRNQSKERSELRRQIPR